MLCQEDMLCRTRATLGAMREITQRQLRNDSGEIMRELDGGESFIVTRNGAPVGELRPIRRRQFVPKAEVLAAFSGVGHIDYKQFRADIDRFVDQDPTPRAWGKQRRA
jgi:antitoxin (DNA-binding transcriptional repressor) of toxin-antitoxin stability system